MKPTILIIHGGMASGKSTITKALEKRLKLRKFVFIDRAYIKDIMLHHVRIEKVKLARSLSKSAVFSLVKELMPYKYNVLLQEERAPSIKKHLGKYIKKYNYRIKSFYFQCSLKTAQKRNLNRNKSPVSFSFLKQMHEEHGYADKEDIIIDTEKNNISKTIKLILNEL